MKSKKLEKDLHNYFKNYKDISNKFNLSLNKKEYGIIFNESELKERTENINQILKEDSNYCFYPLDLISENDFENEILGKNSILLNKEMKEYEEIYNDYNLRKLKYKKNNEINNNNNKNETTNNYVNHNNPNNIIPIQNISNSPNIILTGPQYLNFNPSINTNILNFQDKAQILTELNNNIAKFTSGIPKLVNKVNEALNKIYANTENPIKKAINNHPFVIMASKATHHTIKKNIDNIVENIVDELIGEMKDELNDIERKENKNIMLNNCGKIQKKLNSIKEDEIIILKKYGN